MVGMVGRAKIELSELILLNAYLGVGDDIGVLHNSICGCVNHFSLGATQ